MTDEVNNAIDQQDDPSNEASDRTALEQADTSVPVGEADAPAETQEPAAEPIQAEETPAEETTPPVEETVASAETEEPAAEPVQAEETPAEAEEPAVEPVQAEETPAEAEEPAAEPVQAEETPAETEEPAIEPVQAEESAKEKKPAKKKPAKKKAAKTKAAKKTAAPAEEEEAEAPVEEEEKSDKMDWYILKVQSNREDSIREGLLRRVKIAGLEYFVGDVIVPTEKVTEVKAGKKRVTRRKLYPGYIVVNMEVNDDTWFLVRETPGIGDFTGAAGNPTPMAPHEVAKIVAKEEEKAEKSPLLKIAFRPGDRIKIVDGNFENFEGDVENIDQTNGRVTVMINIFNRSTPVTLEYWQIESV